jgi:hypothetical protein
MTTKREPKMSNGTPVYGAEVARVDTGGLCIVLTHERHPGADRLNVYLESMRHGVASTRFFAALHRRSALALSREIRLAAEQLDRDDDARGAA